MKKITNYRPILFVAIALILGGYSFVSAFKYDWSVFVILGVIAVALGVVVYFWIKTKQNKIIIRFICLMLVPFIVGGLVVTKAVNKKLDTSIVNGYYLVEGTITGGGVTKDGSNTATLTSVKLIDMEASDDAEGEYFIDEDIYLVGYSTNEFYVGDKVQFVGYLAFTYGEVRNDPLKASESVAVVKNISDIEVLATGDGLKYNILKWSKNALHEHMDTKNANVANAMIFGEKLLMDSETKTQYNVTGLAHILAVSGLHVGFVILLFGFLLKKICKNNWIYSIILMSVLIFYAYLCGWVPSVIRAVVMCGVVLLSNALFVQYDGLNALSIAGIVNFIVNPLNIFNIGFLLSFFVVFSILSIAPQIRYLLKNKMPKKLASSVAVTASAWFGGVPIIMFYFESVTPYAIVVNLLVVPFVGVIFITSVACLALSAVFNIDAFFLNIAEFMINCLNTVVEGFSLLKGSSLQLTCSYPILILGVCALIVASDYTFIKRRWLYAYTLAFGFLCCALVFSFS